MAWANPKVIPASRARISSSRRARGGADPERDGNASADGRRRSACQPADLQTAWFGRPTWPTRSSRQVEEGLDEAAGGPAGGALGRRQRRTSCMAAKTLLTQTTAGRRRGFGSGSAVLDESDEAQPVAIKWLETTKLPFRTSEEAALKSCDEPIAMVEAGEPAPA